MLTEYEKRRLRPLMQGTFSLAMWGQLLSFYLGRPVDLVETDAFLREEADRQAKEAKREDTWNGLQRTS